MEENPAIQIDILNQTHKLVCADFIDFNQTVSKQQLDEIKIPFKKFDQSQHRVMNIFLYYIVSIQKNFKVFNEDTFGDKYRALCIKEISDYYIKNKMAIELFEFSFLASKILAMQLQECAHIIYYLIYGRFASHPYINTLCGRKYYDFKRKGFKRGRDTFDNLKVSKKRTMIHSKNPTEFELDIFHKDLKNALKSQDSANLWRNNLNDKKKQIQTKKNENQRGQSLHATQRKTLKHGHSFNTFIPQRITQDQNSSILQSLPFQKRSNQTCTDWNRKGLMRKQKFNQFFDIKEFKLNTKLKKSPSAYTQQNKQNYNRGNPLANTNDFSLNVGGKINYENFKEISNELKIKNSGLDKIRYQCAVRNHKYNFQKQNVQTPMDGLMKGSQTAKQLNKLSAKWSKIANFMQKHSNETDQSDKFEKTSLMKKFTLTESFYNKDPQLTKNLSYQPQRHSQQIIFQFQNDKPDEYVINLLRNDESTKLKQRQQGKKLDYFSKTTVGFKKLNCKHKLQKYKSDYRKFMKTQLLDRIRQAN